MVINKKKMNEKDSKFSEEKVVSQSISSSGVISSTSASSMVTSGDQKIENVVISSPGVGVIEETPLQKSSSIKMMKSSVSSKVSSQSSSQESKTQSSSSTSVISSSKVIKTGKTRQPQSQSNSTFLRGERTFGDIEGQQANNDSILIESVDLNNVDDSFAVTSNLDNLVSIEIESKGTHGVSSVNELITNTTSRDVDSGNRNDVTVENGRKSEKASTSATAFSSTHMDVKESTSFIKESSAATSSSTFKDVSLSLVSTSDDKNTDRSPGFSDARSTKTIRNGKVVDSCLNIDENFSSFPSAGNLVVDSKETKSSSFSNVSSSKVLRNGKLVDANNFSDSSSTYVTKNIAGVDDKLKQNSVTTNAASKKTVRNGNAIDIKNVSDTTTTFTSKVFDDKTKSWVIIEQSSVNETDIVVPSTNEASSSKGSLAAPNTNLNVIEVGAIKNNGREPSTPGFASASNVIQNLAVDSSSIIIDTTVSHALENESANSKIDSMTSNKVDSMISDNKLMMRSNVQSSSRSTKEVFEKNMSSKKESNRDEKIVSTSSNETIQVFDAKSKTWKNVDAKSLNQQRRPSYVRYRSQNADGSWHTTYKRKLYDEFSKQWRIVDEKVVSSDDATRITGIPEMIENDMTNMTTTTYTTKVYDTKTGKWTIVEEKSFVDSEPVNVTQDIKREIERDQPDLANIITTTETTKVRNIITINC